MKMRKKAVVWRRVAKFFLFAGIYGFTGQWINAQTALDTIPFTIEQNLIFIQVRVNDSQPLNFLFDTGAGVTVINEKTADRLALERSDTARIKTAGKTIRSATSGNNTLAVGGLTLEDISLEIIGLDHLSEVLFQRVDGIIGFDLLNRLVVETNIDRQAVHLYDPADFIYQGDGNTLKMINLEHGHFGALVTLDVGQGQKTIQLPLKFDTGYVGHIILNNRTVKRYQLVKANKRYHEIEGFSADATITINYRSKVKKIILAGKKQRNIPTVLLVDEISIAAAANSRSDGLIGQELLLDFNIIYDYPRGLIHMEER